MASAEEWSRRWSEVMRFALDRAAGKPAEFDRGTQTMSTQMASGYDPPSMSLHAPDDSAGESP